MKWRIVLVALVGCSTPAHAPEPPTPGAVARAESRFLEARTMKDRLDVARLRGWDDSVTALRPAYLAARAALEPVLAIIDSAALADSVDRRALRVMQQILSAELTITPQPPAGAPDLDSSACRYDPRTLTGTDSLETRLYACYGIAANDVRVDGGRLDRLTVLGLLGTSDDPERRRRLFIGLDRVWRSVNGDNDSISPWRELLRRRAREWGAGPTPFARRVTELGFAPDIVRDWLVRLLEIWRATLPDSVQEPWDLYYAMGGASRRLGLRIPLDSLRAINDRFYRDLGADPDRLNVQYDLEPRTGKDPVAFTTFGARPGWEGGSWRPGAPYISSSYPTGDSTTWVSSCTKQDTRSTSPVSAPGRRSPTGRTRISSPRRSPTSLPTKPPRGGGSGVIWAIRRRRPTINMLAISDWRWMPAGRCSRIACSVIPPSTRTSSGLSSRAAI